VRAPDEPIDAELRTFYDTLLNVLRRDAARSGRWQLLECAPAWSGNYSWDGCLAWTWQNGKGEKLLIAVNYAPHQSQCFVRLPFVELGGRTWRLIDLLGSARYERDGNDLLAQGLYLDVPGWTAHVFEMAS